MLLLGFPSDRGATERYEITSKGTMSDGETRPIGIIVSCQGKWRIRSQEDALAKIALWITNHRESGLLMISARCLHKLIHSINSVSKLWMSQSNIDHFANQTTIAIRHRK